MIWLNRYYTKDNKATNSLFDANYVEIADSESKSAGQYSITEFNNLPIHPDDDGKFTTWEAVEHDENRTDGKGNKDIR